MTADLLRPRRPATSFLPVHALLVVAFGVGLIVLLWGLTVREVDKDWHAQELAVERNLASFARAMDGHLGAAVRAIDASLLLLRSEYLVNPEGMQRHAAILTRSLLEDGLAQIAIIGADGFLTYSNLNDAARIYLGDREHFRVHESSVADQLYISQPVRGRLSGKLTLQFTRKILRPDGSFAGVVVLSVDPAYFARFYDALQLGTQGVVTLVGTDRVIRARSSNQQQALGKRLAEHPLFAPNAAPQGHFHDRSPVDQVQRLYAYRRLADLPLIIVVGIAEAEAFAHLLEQRRDYLGAALLGTIGIALFIAVLLVQTRRQFNAEARYRHLMQNASDGMVVCDRQGIIRDVNHQTCRSLGYGADELLGLPYTAIDKAAVAQEPGAVGSASATAAADAAPTREGLLQRKDGSRFPVETSLSLIPGSDSLMLRIVRDISERKQLEERMWSQANFDSLTGLPNRALFQDRLGVAIAQAKRRGKRLTLMFLDLDHFKEVNDTLGHAAGDQLLKTVAGRLRTCVREEDTVARMGGDEFCLILPDLCRREEAAVVAQAILDVLQEPFLLDGRPVSVSGSIGITLYPDEGDSPEALLRTADRAMYRAKEGGRGRYAHLLS